MAPQADRPPQLHRIDDRDIRLLLLASIAFGGLAQLARAPALQAGGVNGSNPLFSTREKSPGSVPSEH